MASSDDQRMAAANVGRQHPFHWNNPRCSEILAVDLARVQQRAFAADNAAARFAVLSS
jgi:hypothetical protein